VLAPWGNFNETRTDTASVTAVGAYRPGRNLLDHLDASCDDAWVTSFISHTTMDCADAYHLSRWWQAVLDYVEDPDDPNEPGHEECMILSRDGKHRLLFIEVPDSKQVKNRIHFDLRPVEGSRDAELSRLIELGATTVADRRNPDGTGWVVLADPEGNEFCILRSNAEVAAGPA
jgi:Glyoxalase-like domain